MVIVLALVLLILAVIVLYSFLRTGEWIVGGIRRSSRQVEEAERLASEAPVEPLKRRSGWAEPAPKPKPVRNDPDIGSTKLPERKGW
jgi:hypothetical protein